MSEREVRLGGYEWKSGQVHQKVEVIDANGAKRDLTFVMWCKGTYTMGRVKRAVLKQLPDGGYTLNGFEGVLNGYKENIMEVAGEEVQTTTVTITKGSNHGGQRRLVVEMPDGSVLHLQHGPYGQYPFSDGTKLGTIKRAELKRWSNGNMTLNGISVWKFRP